MGCVISMVFLKRTVFECVDLEEPCQICQSLMQNSESIESVNLQALEFRDRENLHIKPFVIALLTVAGSRLDFIGKFRF
jgi:hypothetical protein